MTKLAYYSCFDNKVFFTKALDTEAYIYTRFPRLGKAHHKDAGMALSIRLYKLRGSKKEEERPLAGAIYADGCMSSRGTGE